MMEFLKSKKKLLEKNASNYIKSKEKENLLYSYSFEN